MLELTPFLRSSWAICSGPICGLGLALAFASTALPATAADSARSHEWRAVSDDVYLQAVDGRIATSRPVTAVAVFKNTAYAVVDGSLRIVAGETLQDCPGAPKGVRRLLALDGALWAAADSGAYRSTGASWELVDSRPFVDFCLHLGRVYGATPNDLFRFDNGKFVNIKPNGGYLTNDSTMLMEDFTEVLADPVNLGPIMRVASYSGTLYVLRPGSLALLDGKVFTPDPIDWGRLPSSGTRDMLVQGSRLYVATDRGLGVLRGMSMTALHGSDGLPYEDTTCLSPGFDDDLWIGTMRGAIRKVGGEYQYFGASNWLPGDVVEGIAVGDHVVYIATDSGLGIIRYEPYTLQKKAAYYQRELDEWGFKRLGFINPIYRAGDEWQRAITDNDGGYTAHYLAAMAFKYAATGDEGARKEAVEAFNAIAWCADITGKPGFIARAIRSIKADKGHRDERGSGGLPAKWYQTPDGQWIWKGDTSSDEVDGHMYAVSLFHDLAAKGREKERAKNHIARLAAHIMDHGWVLEDKDGKPTRWGRWDPKYLLTPYGFESRGLNGMQAQCYMITAHALTGDPKFQQGLEQLLKWRYQTYTVRQKLTFPPDSVVTWDDELAFRTYHSILRYARDPELRSIYLRSIERSWEVLRIQRFPWFNFIYGALTGNDCEAPEAVENLRDWSLDLVSYNYRNSHRADLLPRPGYTAFSPIPRALSSRETGMSWDSGSALEYDGGSGGWGVTPPIAWLEAYWMGRYYGLIEAPKTKESDALTIRPRPFTRHGAPPYAGPPRPPAP